MFKHSVVKSGKQWKVRVRKESKLQTLGREKRRMRREKVMEAEKPLAPSHEIMEGCRK